MRRDPETGAEREFWFVDVVFEHPDGRRTRVRKVSPVQTRRGAEEYERQLRATLLSGRERKGVPTFKEFADEWMASYVAANNSPGEQANKRGAMRFHLFPALGGRRLDEIKG